MLSEDDTPLSHKLSRPFSVFAVRMASQDGRSTGDELDMEGRMIFVAFLALLTCFLALWYAIFSPFLILLLLLNLWPEHFVLIAMWLKSYFILVI
jgi:hypothetical protein